MVGKQNTTQVWTLAPLFSVPNRSVGFASSETDTLKNFFVNLLFTEKFGNPFTGN